MEPSGFLVTPGVVPLGDPEAGAPEFGPPAGGGFTDPDPDGGEGSWGGLLEALCLVGSPLQETRVKAKKIAKINFNDINSPSG